MCLQSVIWRCILVNKMIHPNAGDQTNAWYEWYIGIDFLVDLINPNSLISCVIFQANDSQKLDDIVVRYKDGSEKRFQIKHTTDNSKLGLATLISEYLKDFSKEWKTLYTNSNKMKFILYTNRQSSNDWNGDKNQGKYLRPKLSTFWSYIKSIINGVNSVDEIVMENDYAEWEKVWTEFLEKISDLKTDNDDLRLKFLESFDIQLGRPNLFKHEELIIAKIEEIYSVDSKRANNILDKLKSKLSDWVTKDGKLKRNSQEVSHEMVIRALFETLPNQYVGQHDLPVIANGFESRKRFASELKDILNGTDKKIVFLSGSPQSGKTTLVSYLYSVEKAIDFRFHAFKPIMVDNSNMGSDKGVSSYRGLWGDLYIQIVEYIYNNSVNLDGFNITPFVDWIDDDNLQRETLRILGELGKKVGKKIIVAIDGIDHAARSGDPETFLNRFCYPDNIPANVCLLIAGQPYEAYKDKYPLWITNTEYVKMCDIPAIEKEDITKLLNSLPAELDRNIIKDIIFEVSNGNTLSAVFAAKEAEKCKDIESFKSIIESRKLKCGVDAYYNAIWEYCRSEITSYLTVKENISEIELSIAIALSIIEKPLSIDLFSEINNALILSQSEWVSIFEKLQPMVIVEDNKVSCEISDVRVFFKGRINVIYSTEKLNEIKIKLAEYFYTHNACIYERHYINYELLKSSKPLLFVENLNAEYISETFVIGQKVLDIRDQIQFAISIALSNKRDDLLVNICASLKIFEQFNKSTEYAGYMYKEAVNDFYFLTGEIAPYENNYIFTELESILNDALFLCEKEKTERSIAIIDKHFSERNISEIINVFCREMNDKIVIHSHYQELIQKLGQICKYCEKDMFAVSENNTCKISNANFNIFMSNFFKGWFVAATKNDYKDFDKTFSILSFIALGNELFVFLKNAHNDGKWNIILENIDLICSFNPDKPVVLQLLSWQIQNKNINDDFNVVLDDIRNQGVYYLDGVYFGTSETNEYKMFSFMNLAFCLGYCETNDDFTHLIDEYYNFIDDKERKLFELMLWANLKVGSAFSSTPVLEDFKVLVNIHLQRDNPYYSNLYVCDYVNDLFNKLMKLSSDMCELRTHLFSESKSRLTLLENEEKWDWIISPIILPFLYELGEKRLPRQYMNKIAGEKGVVWKWSLSSRTSEFHSIKRCAKQISMSDEFMMQLDDYNKCFVNGYTEHKEDVLCDLVTCLEAIVAIRPDLWKNYLDEIIQITLAVEGVSDANSILAVYNIFAACAYKESVDTLYKLVKTFKLNYVGGKIHIVRYVFHELLEANVIKLDDALILWKYFYDYFNKPQEFNAYEMKWLAETKNTVLSYCCNNSIDIQKFYKIEQVNGIWDYHNTASIDKTEDLDSCTFDELLIKLESDSSRKLLQGIDCLKFLEKVTAERPVDSYKYIKQLCRLISEQKMGYTLRSSGFDDVYLRVYELLCDNELFEFLGNAIKSQKNERENSQWAHIVYDILQHFYLYINKNELLKMEKLIFSIIDIHKVILSGKSKIDLPTMYIHNLDSSGSDYDWNDILQLLS